MQVIGPDGRYVFNGPRLAMAVNEEPAYNAVKLFNHHPYRDDAIDYTGPCVDHAKELSCIVHGGQVVLTQHAWIAVQDHLPGQAEVSGTEAEWCNVLVRGWLPPPEMQ